jgi:phenylalanyl-tRNA synthetase beta chain
MAEIKTGDCLRYTAVMMEIKKVGTSPAWMKKVLETCGQRAINGVVDILNYVMLETGQPMHAFDADKVEGKIMVRKAKKGEKITTIDNREIDLSPDHMVIADQKKALAIAGVKGGKEAEITDKTKRVIIESACFDAGAIYRTARDIDLRTDASQRYGHGMSPFTTEIGAGRAISLIEDICGGEVIGETDVYPKKQPKTVIKFDIDRFSKITGVVILKDKAYMILRRLGFKVNGSGLVEVPPERMDVTIFEDLVEEVIRIYGLDAVRSVPPTISLHPAHSDGSFAYKERIKNAIVNAGYDEIYSYSFGEEEGNGIELQNPMNREKRFMRASLIPSLKKVIDGSSKSFDDIKIFEVGKVFEALDKEHWSFAVAARSKKSDQMFRELKGAISEVAGKGGIVDISFRKDDLSSDNRLVINIDGKAAGILEVADGGKVAYVEMDMEKMMVSANEEFEYKPISPYPSIMRDISVWVPSGVLVQELVEAMELSEAANLEDTDLIDYFSDNGRTAVTFRVIFQSYEKTLSDAEVDVEMGKINTVLRGISGVEIR